MNHKEVESYRNDLSERLARLEEKHDSHYDMTKDIKGMLRFQNKRISELEKKQSWLMGGLGAVTFVFGTLMAWIRSNTNG